MTYVSIEAELVDYPTITPSVVTFSVSVLTDCANTEIIPSLLSNITVQAGAFKLVTEYIEFSDSSSIELKTKQHCGQFKYSMLNNKSTNLISFSTGADGRGML